MTAVSFIKSISIILILITLFLVSSFKNQNPTNKKSFLNGSKKEQLNSYIEDFRRILTTKDLKKEEIDHRIDWIEANAPLNTVKKQLEGKWELFFSSLIGNGYFPVSEVIDFYEYSLTGSWGPIPLGSVKGSSKVLKEKPLVVEWSQDEITIGPGPFKLKPDPKDKKSYTFLHFEDDLCVARSYKGSGSILRKIKD